jgi:hypothetical protein
LGGIVKLHFGVIDVPYAEAGGQSTGDVAEILEEKYAVMGNFDALHHDEFEELVAISISEAIENLVAGAPADLVKPFAQACTDIKSVFTQYLNDEEIAATGQAGVPTQAALDGVRTSLKKKKEIKNIKTYRSRVRGTRRPSFVDTGLYRDGFIAWVD